VTFSGDLFAADSAGVGHFFLLEHELPRLFDVAVAAEQAFDPPVISGLVTVAPELLAAYRAVHRLPFAENVQAKLLPCTGTKTYVGAILGANYQYYVIGKLYAISHHTLYYN
jgi:hypothetical protein